MKKKMNLKKLKKKHENLIVKFCESRVPIV